jgi:hypothetical protein
MADSTVYEGRFRNKTPYSRGDAKRCLLPQFLEVENILRLNIVSVFLENALEKWLHERIFLNVFRLCFVLNAKIV